MTEDKEAAAYVEAFEDGRQIGMTAGFHEALDRAIGALLDLRREWDGLAKVPAEDSTEGEAS